MTPLADFTIDVAPLIVMGLWAAVAIFFLLLVLGATRADRTLPTPAEWSAHRAERELDEHIADLRLIVDLDEAFLGEDADVIPIGVARGQRHRPRHGGGSAA